MRYLFEIVCVFV